MSIDWKTAAEGFDFHFQAKRKNDVGGFYRVAKTKDRFETESGSYILFSDIHELADLLVIHSRPVVTEWTGEGPPPVGCVCEFEDGLGGWHQIEITAIARKGICFVEPGRNGENYVGMGAKFRPIRTPEQIAAEEREKAVGHMWSVWNANFEGHVKDGLYALYDSGYIKKVQP